MQHLKEGLLRQRPVFYLVLATVALLFAAGLSAFALRGYVAETERIQGSYEVRIALERLLSHLKDTQRGERGFILTGQEAYLAPYRSGRLALELDLQALSLLYAGDLEGHERIVRVEREIREVLTDLEVSIDLMRTQGAGPAMALVRAGEIKAQIDDISSQVGRLQAREEVWFREARTRVVQRGRVLVFAVVLLNLVAFGAFAFAIAGVKRAGAAQRRLEATRAETELQESEDRFRQIAQAVPGVFWMSIPALHRVLYVSPAYEALWGRSVEGLYANGREWLDAVHPADRAGVEAAYEQMDRTGFFDQEYRVVRPDESIVWIHDRGFLGPGRPGEAARFIGFSEDVTEEKQARGERDRLIQELARSNRELEQFAYVASHDLQEPLRGVNGAVRFLARQYTGRLDADADQMIAFAVDGVSRMHQLILDLLAYSRVSTNTVASLDQVDLNEVLAHTLANLAVAVEEAGAEVAVSNPLPVVTADRGQMVQLFQNLIGNALKFCAPGRVCRVSLSAEREGEAWVISVQDNGIGIEARYWDRIFQVFQRLHTREEYGGTGIGLAICKKIVERHGGRIWVDSEPGAGSTFRFTMPARR